MLQPGLDLHQDEVVGAGGGWLKGDPGDFECDRVVGAVCCGFFF